MRKKDDQKIFLGIRMQAMFTSNYIACKLQVEFEPKLDKSFLHAKSIELSNFNRPFHFNEIVLISINLSNCK